MKRSDKRVLVRDNGYRRRLDQGASSDLLRNLAGIAIQFMDAVSSNSGAITLLHFKPKHLRELGVLLDGIAQGKDAHRLFRQNERKKKPQKIADHKISAVAYWAQRAVEPGSKGNKKAALRAARAILPSLRDLSDVTVMDIAKKHRKESLALLTLSRATFELMDGSQIRPPTPQEHASLLQYLQKKQSRSKPV